MWTNLPQEILHIILLKLPVKSLIKCTTLSKYHHSAITSPNFITAHIDNNTRSLLLRYSPGKGSKVKFVFAPDDTSFSGYNTEAALEAPFEVSSNCCNILGSINGVICLVDDWHRGGTEFILWNPSIRKYVELPMPIHHYFAIGPYESVSGFMFDPISQDFKVVRVVEVTTKWCDPKRVEVYSMRSGCWRDLGTFDLNYGLRPRIRYRSFFLHGCVNWLVFHDSMVPLVLKFNMSSESFGVMKMPSCFTDANYLEIQEFRGMLGLIHTDHEEDSFRRYTCCLWVMKEYGDVGSWSKIHVFNPMPSLMLRTFGILGNQEIIMGKFKDECRGIVVAVDSTKGTERALGEIFGEFDSFCPSTYVESLALFGERMDKQCESATKEQEKEALF